MLAPTTAKAPEEDVGPTNNFLIGGLLPGGVVEKGGEAAPKVHVFGSFKVDTPYITRLLPPTKAFQSVDQDLVKIGHETITYDPEPDSSDDSDVEEIDEEGNVIGKPKKRKARKRTRTRTEKTMEPIGAIKYIDSCVSMVGTPEDPSGRVMAHATMNVVLQGDSMTDFYVGAVGQWKTPITKVTQISEPDEEGHRRATLRLLLELDIDESAQVPKRIGQVGLIFGHDGEQVRKAMEATHALRDAAWINLTPTGTRTTLHILEVLKRWCYKRTGVIINFATIGEAACGKSTGNAAMIKEYRSVVIGMGDKFGTSKTDSYPMAFDDDPSNAYVSIVDTPGFSGMEYMRVEGQDGTVKYVLAPDQPEGGEAPNPKRPMLPRVKALFEYAGCLGVPTTVHLGSVSFDELLDVYKTGTFRGRDVPMQPADIMRMNVNARTLVNDDLELFRRIVMGDEKPSERSALHLAKKGTGAIVGQLIVTRTEQLMEELGLSSAAFMLPNLVQRNCGDDVRKTKSKGRAKTIKGGHVGTYIKRFEEWLSSYLGGIKVTCISSKISGVDPTLEELERFGVLNIKEFVELVHELLKQRMRTKDKMRRDRVDKEFKDLVKEGIKWDKVVEGFKSHFGMTVDQIYNQYGLKKEEDEDCDDDGEVRVVLPDGHEFLRLVAQFSRFGKRSAIEVYDDYKLYQKKKAAGLLGADAGAAAGGSGDRKLTPEEAAAAAGGSGDRKLTPEEAAEEQEEEEEEPYKDTRPRCKHGSLSCAAGTATCTNCRRLKQRAEAARKKAEREAAKRAKLEDGNGDETVSE